MTCIIKVQGLFLSIYFQSYGFPDGYSPEMPYRFCHFQDKCG